MKKLNPQKVFVQYRGMMRPYEPIKDRKYTITHSDKTADLFVVIDEGYAEDQVTRMRDEVRVAWTQTEKGLILMGSVIVSGPGIRGNALIRNQIFYKEMPTALQALRQADRFLFEKNATLDQTPVVISFISDNPIYNKTYEFGVIGDYQ